MAGSQLLAQQIGRMMQEKPVMYIVNTALMNTVLVTGTPR